MLISMQSLNSIIASCILASALAITTVVRAEYKPPTSQKPPTGKTTGTISRGGCSGGAESLTALAPYSHVGQTSSPHPTLAWFVPDSQSYAMEVRLDKYDPSGDRTRLRTVQLQSQPGIMVLSLSEQKLSTGRYRWQVVILCNPNRPSSALVVEADIDVVDRPADLADALSAARPLTRVNLFAESGLWYDALGEALRAEEPTIQALLADLAALEASSAPAQHEKLKQILEANEIRIYRGSSD